MVGAIVPVDAADDEDDEVPRGAAALELFVLLLLLLLHEAASRSATRTDATRRAAEAFTLAPYARRRAR